jgi:hypothetical protein
VLGIFAYGFILDSSDKTFVIEKGLWIEAPESGGKYAFGSPIILEKVPNKDLVLFSLSGDKQTSKLLQITRNEKNLTEPLNLLPLFDCSATSRMEYEKLKLSLVCKDRLEKNITLEKANVSVFNGNSSEELNQKEIASSLLLVSKVESLNKKIHSIKKITKDLLEKTNSVQEIGSDSDDSQSESTNISLSTYLKNPDLLKEDYEKNSKGLELADNERKELIRISNKGSDINLASRLNKIEWGILAKKWKKHVRYSKTILFFIFIFLYRVVSKVLAKKIELNFGLPQHSGH